MIPLPTPLKHFAHGPFKWILLWTPVAGLLAIDLLYQGIAVWKQSDIVGQAQPWFLLLAALNQLAVYVVLIPAMRKFYAKTGIMLSTKHAFSMLATGLAFARIVPAGEYIVWRTTLRRHRGSATATTQWQILYWTWMTCGLLVLFVLSEMLTFVLYPNTHTHTLVGSLRYLPILVSLVFLAGLFATRFAKVRGFVRKIAFDKIGSQAAMPQKIIRERKLGRDALGALTFASVATWTFESFTVFLCLQALGLDVPVVLTVFAFTFARLFSLLPLAPGGAGQIESAAAVVLLAYSYPFELVFTALLLYRLVSYWPPVLLGLTMYFIGKGPKTVALIGSVSASQLHKRTGRQIANGGAR
jgi:uncharacterized protein (TIRG00374 family)